MFNSMHLQYFDERFFGRHLHEHFPLYIPKFKVIRDFQLRA